MSVYFYVHKSVVLQLLLSRQPSEQSDWFIFCAISPQIALFILYGHCVCSGINYTVMHVFVILKVVYI